MWSLKHTQPHFSTVLPPGTTYIEAPHKIIGCDFHTRYQQIAMMDTDTIPTRTGFGKLR